MNRIQQYKKLQKFKEYDNLIQILDSDVKKISDEKINFQYNLALDNILLIASESPYFDHYSDELYSFLENKITSNYVEILCIYKKQQMNLISILKSEVKNYLDLIGPNNFVVGNYKESRSLAVGEYDDGYLIEEFKF